MQVQRNRTYPLISSYEGELVNVFRQENSSNREPSNHEPSSIQIIQKSINETEYNENNKEQHDYEVEIAYLHEILDKTKELLEESRNKPKGHLWLKNIRSNFRSLENMNNDIAALNNRITMPRTWKDFNKNTMYW
ncbi:20667_t:CDS:2, partial [Cetraspora pellucida]